MNSRERVLAALNHQQPDRPPRDLGSTTATGIHPTAYQALKRALGMEPGFEYLSSRALLARVEGPVIERFGIDLLPLITPASAEEPELDENRTYLDRWGVERRLPEGGGHYLVSRPPLAGMSTAEVARRMDTNRNALYKLMHDARQRLKQRMEAEGISLEEALAAFEEERR